MDEIAGMIVQGVRLLVVGAFVLSLVVAFTRSAVKDGTMNAFGGWVRFVRSWSDPVLRPLERRLARSGGNPVEAPYWLVGVTVVGGLVIIGIVNWLIAFIYTLVDSASASPIALAEVAAHTIFEVLQLAILIRVACSWLSISPTSKFMRTINALTDWIIDPIRRVVPTLGMFDFSPLIAYFVLSLAEQLVMRGLFG